VLYAVLPSQRDIELIIGASYTPAFLQFFTLPYQRLFSGNMQSASELSRTPKPTDHPVLLARTLLYLAHGIQNLHPSTFDLNSLSLGCSTTTAMTRYLHTASRLVTSNEVLIESLEGLECLILEAVFHINVGNLRRAWITFRRAIGLAQLMGLHAGQTSGFAVLDPRSQSLPAMMWYRIVGQDRYLSLVLGLPPGTAEDLSFASQAQMPGDCATGQLERQHYDIMGRMAGRSAMSGRKIDQDFTRNVDLALQKAAQCVDASWWLVPRASHATQSIGMDNERSLEDVGRILVQINHYNLLVTLHLPSVLSSYGTHADDYGPTTCLNSSRELLSRYIRLRCIRVAPFCCRMIDFSAFTACLALLSAHIARHQRVSDRMDSLAHQHLSDRATVEETITLLPEASKVDTDTGLLQQAAAILECLSVIEANAAARSNANLTVESTTSDGSSSCRSVRVKVPFIGPVTISANGISADLSERPSDTTLSDHQDSEGWSHSLDLPLSPSVYFFQEYGTLEGLDVAPPNSVDEVIGPETMPWSLAAQ
jgi:hypothetical protein